MKIGSKLCLLEHTAWPIFNSGLDFIKMNILTKFHEDWIKTVPSGMYWPNDLVLTQHDPFFNSGLDFIKMNILTKFHEDWIKTVPSGVYWWFY